LLDISVKPVKVTRPSAKPCLKWFENRVVNDYGVSIFLDFLESNQTTSRCPSRPSQISLGLLKALSGNSIMRGCRDHVE
jgi:hypothetical protein